MGSVGAIFLFWPTLIAVLPVREDASAGATEFKADADINPPATKGIAEELAA